MIKPIKFTDHISLIIALISFIGAVFYRFSNLKILSVYLILFLSLISYLIIVHFLKKVNPENKNTAKKSLKIANQLNSTNKQLQNKQQRYLSIILSFLLLISLFFSFFTLFNARSTEALISPWQVLPNYFFLLISISALLLIILIFLKSRFNLVFIILFSFLLNSIAIIVYKFGFGFDFFIHQSTMELINATGAVEPKPFYYLGQYSLIIILHKIFFIPIYYLHLLLVPMLASILIPINLYQVLKEKFSSQININLSLLALVTLPLGIFFSTTPQNLAYLFLVLIIIRGLNCRNYFDIVYLFAFALAALVTQAIAGIPALLLAIAVTFYYSDIGKIKNHFYRLLFIVSAISLPGAFLLLNKINKQTSSDTQTSNSETSNTFINTILEQLTINIPQQENVILNFIYFFALNLNLLILIILGFGAYTVYKHKKEFKIYKIYILMSLGFFVSFIITNNLSFDYLISYERAAFSTRIFLISLLLIIPFFIVSIFTIINSLGQKKNLIKIIFISFWLVLIPSFLYIKYHRLDNYHNSHGYSVSQADIDAVHYIEDDAKNDYLVLANQQTSVAALREFGFTKYYQTDEGQSIFYYPIPTGGPLYVHFLTMVDDKPSRKTMLAAMDLANVDTAYFSINKYWWAAAKTIEEAKIEADEWKSINNRDVFVFKFIR